MEKLASNMSPQLVHSGMLTFDVGANAGYYTLLLARRVGPNGRVVAFEPNPINVAYLREHLRLNKFCNVEIVEAAVTDTDGTAFFSGTGSMGKLSKTGMSVETVRLDDYPHPDFVKIGH